MANNPRQVAASPTPTIGSGGLSVNDMFTGPDLNGVLNALPPMFGPAAVTPLTVTNGVDSPKLGVGHGQSKKTHG